MKLVKNRLIIGCMCVVLAFAVGFLGIPALTDWTSDKVQVVVANQGITKGTLLTEGMFRIVEMSRGDLPYSQSELYSSITQRRASNEGQSVTPSNSDFIFGNNKTNLYAAIDITANDLISRSKITSVIPYKDKELRDLETNEYAIAVSAGSLDLSVSGKIRAGDVVTPLIVSSDKTVDEAAIYDEIEFMEVISVSTKDGYDIEGDTTELLPSYVILKCNKTQARILAQAAANYKIHFAFAAHATSDRAVELLEQQERYFQNN